MKHLFSTHEELQEAHEQLAYVEYLYANRTNISQFVCINIQNYGYGNFEGQEPYDGNDNRRLRVSRILRDEVQDRIYPYHTAEWFLANRDGLTEPNEVDSEVAYQFRVELLATMLKELA